MIETLSFSNLSQIISKKYFLPIAFLSIVLFLLILIRVINHKKSIEIFQLRCFCFISGILILLSVCEVIYTYTKFFIPGISEYLQYSLMFIGGCGSLFSSIFIFNYEERIRRITVLSYSLLICSYIVNVLRNGFGGFWYEADQQFLADVEGVILGICLIALYLAPIFILNQPKIKEKFK